MSLSLPMNQLPALAQWILLNFVFAVFPLLFCWIYFYFRNVDAGWPFLVKNGEMFFYSVTISAYSLGSLLLSQDTDLSSPGIRILILSIAIVLAFSAMVVGVVTTQAVLAARNPVPELVRLTETENRRFAGGSTAMAIAAAVLGYASYSVLTR